MSTWERALFVLLIAGSAVLFVRGLAGKLRPVLAGAPDPRRTEQPALRLRRTLRQVLTQNRVLAGRPVVGMLHAAIFFGFLLFALETTEHLLKAFGLSLLQPLFGSALPLFRTGMAAVAVLVIAAVAGLAFRRFVLVRTSPDPRSWTSALVALFIVLLMLTYLNGSSASPLAPRANWWLHSAVLLAFPLLILRSKHLHILLAPVAIFFRRARLGDYQPLDLAALAEAPDGEETQLGLETVGSMPWKMRLDFLSCVECRRCTDNCPAAQAGNNGLDPRAFVLAGRQALVQCSADDPVIGNIVSEAALAACVTCGACQDVCPVGVEHLDVLIGAKRAQALATGRGVVAGDFFRAIEVFGNGLARPRQERQALLDDLALPRFSNGDQWLLWLGCVWGFNRSQRGAVAALRLVLDAAGVSYGVLADEPCCGHHSRRQGEEAQFQELAGRSLALLRKHGVRRIVTPCPHCLHTLRRDYERIAGGLPLEVVHHSELLSRLLDGGALQLAPRAEPAVAAYHDPCYLARFEASSEAPRAVLAAAGVTVRELPHGRERTLCCGGGAAGFAREQRVDGPRRAEITASGAPLLVTACPECRMMLDATLDRTLDIAEAVALSLRRPPELRPAGGDGGLMLAISPGIADLEARMMKMFLSHPGEELQLLDIAGKSHISGKLSDLKYAADELVEVGALLLIHRNGGRFYQLANGDGAPAESVVH